MINWWISREPDFKALVRIAAGFTFCLAGTTKVFGFPGTMPGGGTADLSTQIGLAGMIESLTGLLICIGLFTRPAAFLASGTMAVAYWQVHAPKNAWPTLNGGVLAAMYCFLFLYFSAAGAGKWSIDEMRKRK